MIYNNIYLKRITGSSLLSDLKIFFLVLSAFYTMQPYFFWDKEILLIFFAICASMCGFIQVSMNRLYKKKVYENTIVFPLMIVFLFFLYWHFFKLFTKEANIFGIFAKIFLWFIPVLIFILSTCEERIKFLKFFSNLCAVVFSISLIAYFYVFLGGNLSSNKIFHPSNPAYAYFDNYKFFVVVYDKRSVNLIMRFQSVLTEPGHLAMMSALLLYANEYKFKKWQNIVYLISLLFSLSLAGYILLPAGMIIYYFFRSKKKVLMFISFFIIAFIVISFSIIHYNRHPDSIISKLIISRLMPDEERGFSGNNRNTKKFSNKYDEIIKRCDIVTLTGWGNSMKDDFPEGGNASYKNFIYENGIIGFFLLWVMYITFIRKRNRQLCIGMLLLFMLSFVQRPYAIWLSQMFIFIGYCSKNNKLEEICRT